MRDAALQERRNRQILADIVRTYIETGEPVSSRAVSQRFEETLSTATIRNVMADLEDGGLLFQPYTSAGRVPTAAAYRFFAQEIASRAVGENRSGERQNVAAARWACGGGFDFARWCDARQDFAAAPIVFSTGT